MNYIKFGDLKVAECQGCHAGDRLISLALQRKTDDPVEIKELFPNDADLIYSINIVTGYIVKCLRCNAVGNTGKDRIDSISFWNRQMEEVEKSNEVK